MRLLAGLVAVVVTLGLAAAPTVRAADQDDAHHQQPTGSGAPTGRIGLLVADHGEPPEYNAWTYESFREFFQHLIAMGIVPSWLTAMDTGTILYDANCPACDPARDNPRLIDAWLHPHDGPAVFVPASDSLPAHYVVPDGPGLREPDIYELVGLGAWDEWQRMGGRSPNYDEKLPKKTEVIRRLTAAYGGRLAIRVGYGIDPRFGGAHQGIREALDALVNRDRISALVVVYHGVGFSDIMQTHHLRHIIAEHLNELGAGDLPVRYADPLGTTDHYVRAVVDKVQAELALLPTGAPVAIHLSGHGLSTTKCGDYDCGADAYHRYAADLFARVKPAVEAAIHRSGRTGVFRLYGDGGEGDADPDDKVDSPIEALDKRAADGFAYVVDIPYEFDSNSRDTLIVLRRGYRREPPDWNAAFESRFTYKGMQVKIANASGGDARKTDALEAVARAALDGWITPTRPAAADASAPHAHSATLAARHGDPATVAATHEHPTTADGVDSPGADDAHDHAATVGPRQLIDHDHTPGVTEPASTDLAGAHHHNSPGAGTGTGTLMMLAGAGTVATGVATRRRALLARVILAGVGAQVTGLGWDVLIHARAGEGVDLLENAGHWVALGGLVLTAAAAMSVQRPHAATATVTSEHRR